MVEMKRKTAMSMSASLSLFFSLAIPPMPFPFIHLYVWCHLPYFTWPGSHWTEVKMACHTTSTMMLRCMCTGTDRLHSAWRGVLSMGTILLLSSAPYKGKIMHSYRALLPHLCSPYSWWLSNWPSPAPSFEQNWYDRQGQFLSQWVPTW